MSFFIEAGGLHPTTQICLQALEWLNEQAEFSNILEIGCGGGILTVTAAHAWPAARLLAADISPKAVEDARKAIAAQGLAQRVSVIRSDGFGAAAIGERAPYDLIICNLLAEWLVEMAVDLKNHLSPVGYAITAGSMAWMSAEVEQAYKSLGFEIVKKIESSPWHGCILRYSADT